LADYSVTGVASFSSTNFAVSSTGHVSIKANGVPNTALSFDNITINTLAQSGLAGGGIVALGGSINLSNAGVTSAVAGSGIRLNKGTGEVIITNIGVTSFNGVTGAVSYAPPLATISATGVASFSSSDFGVSSTGHVSLTGNVARTNTANTFSSGLQTFSTGLSAAGATFGGTVNVNGNVSVSGTLTVTNTAKSTIGLSTDRFLAGDYNQASNGTYIDLNDSAGSIDMYMPSGGQARIILPDGTVSIGDPNGDFNGTYIDVNDSDGQINLVGITQVQGLAYLFNGVASGYTRAEWAGLTSSYDIIPSNWESISAPISTSPTQNDAYFAPIFITRRVRIKTIGTQTGTNGASNSGNILLGLYDSDTYGYPKDRLYTSGSIALSTSSFAVQRATGVDVIVNPGQYWLAIVYSAASIPVDGLGRLGTRMKVITPTSSSPIGQASVDGLRKAQGSFTLATSQSGTFTAVEGGNNPALFYTAEVV
jgi:hypothetical protein